MEVARATKEASNCPVTMWPYLLEHATDVLNRTTGPPEPHEPMSSHESVTGSKPDILTTFPIGCRAYAVKPAPLLKKSVLESKAWPGINLGKAGSVPGAYNVWITEHSKVVVTSNVYFEVTYGELVGLCHKSV